jgi:hypothetical protein
MNISPQLPSLPVATAFNPATETLRRENNQREVITKPAATAQSAAEKGVASEKDRGKTPAQNNEQVDFASIRERAEQENTTVNDSSENNQDSSADQNQQETSAEKDQADHIPADEFAEEKQINDLKQRDQEVRSHELAHAAVGGATTGAPSYSFQVGPDGKKYAVNGEVSVDLARVSGNPRATIAKMQKVHAAALAPVNPSTQDNRVAASAAKIIIQAQSELLNSETEQIVKSDAATKYIRNNDVFAQPTPRSSNDNLNDDNEFDQFIGKTLSAQEEIAPSRSPDVSQRALRIENFYLKINQAYEKPPNHQFELTA